MRYAARSIKRGLRQTLQRAYVSVGVVILRPLLAKKTPRKPNAAFMKPMNPSAMLGAVIGMMPMPRTEVTKKIWEYIKKNKLQDAINKRMINADEKLKAVFGGKPKVSMFEMTKMVSNHLK